MFIRISFQKCQGFIQLSRINYLEGEKQDKLLLSGLHTVCDIFCRGCNENIGWKYVIAFEQSQKYKEGRVILEKAQINKKYWSN